LEPEVTEENQIEEKTELPKSICIFVKVPSGKSRTLDVPPRTTIATIKEMVSDLEAIPTSQQRLISGGRELSQALTTTSNWSRALE
jgi:hypothetical protein